MVESKSYLLTLQARLALTELARINRQDFKSSRVLNFVFFIQIVESKYFIFSRQTLCCLRQDGPGTARVESELVAARSTLFALAELRSKLSLKSPATECRLSGHF